MHVLVDGVFFQLNTTGIARLWCSLLPLLARTDGVKVSILDRGGVPSIYGGNIIAFPRYEFHNSAADSFRIQDICNIIGADVFTSTYYTTPISTPMVLVTYDMIPEIFGFDLAQPEWLDKQTALCYAARYLAISYSTRSDLLQIYPEIRSEWVRVAHCGIDRSIFRLRSDADVRAFRQRLQLFKPYFLLVGSRHPASGYKNSQLFFSAIEHIDPAEFDILCVGGELERVEENFERLRPGVGIKRVDLSDQDLSLAYAGAAALVYPSLYEGFGLPVVEAMACGCPVITTRRGSLTEAAGDAAFYIDGTSTEDMAHALQQLIDPHIQNSYRTRGLCHSERFSWEPMGAVLVEQLREAIEASGDLNAKAFHAEWSRLRRMQAELKVPVSALG